MAHLFKQEIQIVCSCGSLKPLTKVYFCRHCVVLRCGYCVSHEVDTIYCSNCLGNLASSEARIKKNRCGSCFSCPCCFHILTVRASTVSRPIAQGAETGTPSKTTAKNYYLFCFFCRWTTRDAKLPDQPTSTSSNWPEHEVKHSARISSLIEYYKMIMLREKLEKENRLFLHSSRRGYQHFSEKFGLTAKIARKRAGLPPLSLGRDEVSTPQIIPAVASEEVESLPDDIFTKPVDVTQITSLPQRFVIPDFQPEDINDLFPVHKQLSVKRSQRCKSCLHNIFKPEHGPASIKFKIHLAAYYYVPEIRLMKKLSMKSGEKCELLLKVINPAQAPTNVRFLHLEDVPFVSESCSACQEEKKDESSESVGSTSLVSVTKKSYPAEKPRLINVKTNGSVEIPQDVINIPARDDTAEYDESNESTQQQDNPAVIVWRKGNKVILKFHVTPDEKLISGDEVKIGFVMRFSFRDKIISPLEQKECKDVDINVRHYLTIGNIE